MTFSKVFPIIRSLPKSPVGTVASGLKLVLFNDSWCLHEVRKSTSGEAEVKVSCYDISSRCGEEVPGMPPGYEPSNPEHSHPTSFKASKLTTQLLMSPKKIISLDRRKLKDGSLWRFPQSWCICSNTLCTVDNNGSFFHRGKRGHYTFDVALIARQQQWQWYVWSGPLPVDAFSRVEPVWHESSNHWYTQTHISTQKAIFLTNAAVAVM